MSASSNGPAGRNAVGANTAGGKPGEDAPPGGPGTVCPTCNGSGRVDGAPCADCGGTGKVSAATGGG